MRLSLCSRSNDVVEPMIKPQWYVNCNSMAMEALYAVMDDDKKKLELIPRQYTAEWRRFLLVIRIFGINNDKKQAIGRIKAFCIFSLEVFFIHIVS